MQLRTPAPAKPGRSLSMSVFSPFPRPKLLRQERLPLTPDRAGPGGKALPSPGAEVWGRHVPPQERLRGDHSHFCACKSTGQGAGGRRGGSRRKRGPFWDSCRQGAWDSSTGLKDDLNPVKELQNQKWEELPPFPGIPSTGPRQPGGALGVLGGSSTSSPTPTHLSLQAADGGFRDPLGQNT